MTDKNPKLEDFLTQEEIEACREAQQRALPLLSSLYKVKEMSEDISVLKNGHQVINKRISTEIRDLEKGFENKFSELINSNNKTSRSIDHLSHNIELLCQKFDYSIKDVERIEFSFNQSIDNLRKKVNEIENSQKTISLDVQTQKATTSTYQRFLPTVAVVIAIAGTLISIYDKISGP